MVALVVALVAGCHPVIHIKLGKQLQVDNTIIKKIVKALKVQLDQVEAECDKETWDLEVP